jgi:hypothetical protein
MKQKDLVIGTEYLTNSSTDWKDSRWSERCVRVVDTEVAWYYWRMGELVKSDHKPSTMFCAATKGVLVDVLTKENGLIVERRAVALAHIKGEWSKTFAEVLAYRQAKNKAFEETNAAAKMISDKIGTVVAKARSAFGLTDYMVRKMYGHDKIEVSVDVFAAMVAELDKQGWSYEQR